MVTRKQRILGKVLFPRRVVDGFAAPCPLKVDSSDSCPAPTETSPPTQPARQDAAAPLGSDCTPPEVPPPGCAVFNNYIFHQDPETGRLSLLPVVLRAAQSLPGLDINPSLVPDLFLNAVPGPTDLKDLIQSEDYLQAPSCFKDSVLGSDLDHSGSLQQKESADPGPGLAAAAARVHPAPTEAIRLLKGPGGREDVAMGT